MKRTNDEPVSPPPVKRKLESTTTSQSVSAFFTPASRREPEKLTWKIVEQTLIIGRYNVASQRDLSRPVKVAAFDLDDTLITPKQGSRYARSGTSWKWWDAVVPGRLKQLYNEGYLVVVFSNQGSIKTTDDKKTLAKDSLSLRNFKDQVGSILRQLDFPLSLYAASGPDRYRKPRTGMWEQLKRDYDLESPDAIDTAGSFYVGDAAGREKTDKRTKDHATSDRDLAANIGIQFHTPEEFFLGHEIAPHHHPFEPRDFLKSAPSMTRVQSDRYKKQNVQELVIFCGSPGAGKSSFYWKVLQPQGYERVNQDILKTREKCLKVARGHLENGQSVVVDNTNRDRQARASWVRIAQEFRVPIRCVHFTASAKLCEHNDTVRALNGTLNPEHRTMLPAIAFRSFAQTYEEPSVEEGFQDIVQVDFEFEGSEEQQQIWSRYWVSKFST